MSQTHYCPHYIHQDKRLKIQFKIVTERSNDNNWTERFITRTFLLPGSLEWNLISFFHGSGSYSECYFILRENMIDNAIGLKITFKLSPRNINSKIRQIPLRYEIHWNSRNGMKKCSIFFLLQGLWWYRLIPTEFSYYATRSLATVKLFEIQLWELFLFDLSPQPKIKNGWKKVIQW